MSSGCDRLASGQSRLWEKQQLVSQSRGSWGAQAPCCVIYTCEVIYEVVETVPVWSDLRFSDFAMV